MSPYRNTVSTSITKLSSFSTIILANAILNETSCATGAKFSVLSTPGIWLYPRATSLALYVPSLLILNTHLFPINLLFSGIFALSIFLETPLLIMLLIFFLIAICNFVILLQLGYAMLLEMFWVLLDLMSLLRLDKFHVSNLP